jgi:hypothetical protein
MQKLNSYPSPSPELPDVTIEARAQIKRVGDQQSIELTYSAGGALEKILWPASLSSKPQRKDELWKHTCFEAFIKPIGSDSYWEVNLSPSGDWNVYRFTSYRQGMAKEESIQVLNPCFSQEGKNWHLSCELWVPDWNSVTGFDVGLTTVLEATSGQIFYLALAHAGTQPDFHLAKSFKARLSV